MCFIIILQISLSHNGDVELVYQTTSKSSFHTCHLVSKANELQMELVYNVNEIDDSVNVPSPGKIQILFVLSN